MFSNFSKEFQEFGTSTNLQMVVCLFLTRYLKNYSSELCRSVDQSEVGGGPKAHFTRLLRKKIYFETFKKSMKYFLGRFLVKAPRDSGVYFSYWKSAI